MEFVTNCRVGRATRGTRFESGAVADRRKSMMPNPPPDRVRQEGRFARLLIRGADRAALATSLAGAPYASFALLAADLDGSPLLLLSDLAQHSLNLKGDPRLSLLVGEAADDRDPLERARLSIMGEARPTGDPQGRARFLARHPRSAAYAGFADFRLYKVAVERGQLIAGFGRILWIKASDILFDGDTGALRAAEAETLGRINDEHRARLEECIRRRLERGGKGWRAIGIDPDGIDLRRRGEVARLNFAAPVSGPEAACGTFQELAAGASAVRGIRDREIPR
jgi:putative heme iron utilization protein